MNLGELLTRVGTVLQDKTHERWSQHELVQWVVDGQRALAIVCPHAFTLTYIHKVVAPSGQQAGCPTTLQTVPDYITAAAGNGDSFLQCAFYDSTSGAEYNNTEVLQLLDVIGVVTDVSVTPESFIKTGTSATNIRFNAGAISFKQSTPIRLIQRRVLDEQFGYPVSDTVHSWHSGKQTSGTPTFYSYDPREPKSFFLYPLPTVNTYVATLVSAVRFNFLPYQMSTISDAELSTELNFGMEFGDASRFNFAHLIVDYVLSRCFQKDADYANDVTRAKAHYDAFMQGAKSLSKMFKRTEPRNFSPVLPRDKAR